MSWRSVLHALERKELIRRERRSAVANESQYVFWHVLVRDVAYGQIPRARRAEKHRLAAEWIERLGPDRTEDRSEMLAHHYLAALEFARAAGQPTDGLHAARSGGTARGGRPCHGAACPPGGDALLCGGRRAVAGGRPRRTEAAPVLRPRADPGRGPGRRHRRAGPRRAARRRRARGSGRGRRRHSRTWPGSRAGGTRRWQGFRRATALLADAPPSPAKGYVLEPLRRVPHGGRPGAGGDPGRDARRSR